MPVRWLEWPYPLLRCWSTKEDYTWPQIILCLMSIFNNTTERDAVCGNSRNWVRELSCTESWRLCYKELRLLYAVLLVLYTWCTDNIKIKITLNIECQSLQENPRLNIDCALLIQTYPYEELCRKWNRCSIPHHQRFCFCPASCNSHSVVTISMLTSSSKTVLGREGGSWEVIYLPDWAIYPEGRKCLMCFEDRF